MKRTPTTPIPVPFVDPSTLPECATSLLRVHMIEDGMGRPMFMPVIVIRGGAGPGPTVGITAAIHGNELNGMSIVHGLVRDIDPEELSGTIVAVPLINVPGFLSNQREFNDGCDLNRIMPGKENGCSSDVYAFRLMERVVHCFDYMIDLHTASFGRINTLYVRANLAHPETQWMARAQHPQIIVDSPDRDGTLRDAAVERGIPSITVEVGDPNRFQSRMIRFGSIGVANVLSHLSMLELEESLPDFEPVRCKRSYWVRTDRGGVLSVLPNLGDFVTKGQTIARVCDIYGQTRAKYKAPQDGIVVGKSTNPVNQTGSRIVHLGVLSKHSTNDLPDSPVGSVDDP